MSFEKSRSRGRPESNRRLLAVASFPPAPVVNGLTLRACSLLRELASEWEIHLIAPGSRDGADAAASPRAAALERIARWRKVKLQGRGTNWPFQYDTSPVLRAVSLEMDEWKPAVGLLWSGSEFVARDISGFPPAVADRVDCATLQAWRELRDATGPRDLLRRANTLRIMLGYERSVANCTHATVVVGDDDARWLRRVTRASNVHVIPNGVRVGSRDELPGESHRPTVVFTGVMAYPPNVDAARFFAREVWPRVRAELPDAEFVIAGRQPTPSVLELRSLERVRVTGEVADMHAVLARAWVAVAPMRRGSGIKNKVLEAWAAATPVVMTTIATNGLPDIEAFREQIADDPESLARAVLRLLRDPTERQRVGDRAYEVAGKASWKQAARRFTLLFEDANPVGSRGGTSRHSHP